MAQAILWHNPRCSKSRQTKALLQEKGISFEEVRYLDNTPSVEELRAVLTKLDLPLRDWMRTKEEAYKTLRLADVTDEDALLQAMSENPRLIERPVVIVGEKAALGRPPENILSLFDNA
jgi:arsenate reductase